MAGVRNDYAPEPDESATNHGFIHVRQGRVMTSS